MKSCEEMARSVMNRAKARRAATKRRVIAATAAAVCVCGVGLLALMGAGTDRTPPPVLQATEKPSLSTSIQPTTPTLDELQGGEEKSPNGITLLHAFSNGDNAVALKKDVKSPHRIKLRVRDYTGATEEEKEKICEEEKAFADGMIDAYIGESKEDWAWSQFPGENAVVTNISAGVFLLRMDNPELVESVYVTVTNVGWMNHIPSLENGENEDSGMKEYYLDSKQLPIYYRKSLKGITMIWGLSPEVSHEIGTNPGIQLSSLKDTITITVTFKDGTAEEHIIDMTIDDRGDVYATYRGVTAA